MFWLICFAFYFSMHSNIFTCCIVYILFVKNLVVFRDKICKCVNVNLYAYFLCWHLFRVLFFYSSTLYYTTIIKLFPNVFSCCWWSPLEICSSQRFSQSPDFFGFSYLLDHVMCKTQIFEQKGSGISYFQLLVPTEDIFHWLLP